MAEDRSWTDHHAFRKLLAEHTKQIAELSKEIEKLKVERNYSPPLNRIARALEKKNGGMSDEEEKEVFAELTGHKKKLKEISTEKK